MNDAVEQDFFFLNFAKETLVLEEGITSGLQNAGVGGVFRLRIAHQENSLGSWMELREDTRVNDFAERP